MNYLARSVTVRAKANLQRRTSCNVMRRCLSSATTITPKKGDKVVVAMSGGVDSSVTARLLANEDYDLSAIFMRNWDTRDESGSDKGCEWEKDWEDVQRVCKTMGLPCRMVDLSKEYWNNVFEPSLRMWEVGHTPNPDVWCNREVKFGALMEHLHGQDTWLATGHYAQRGQTNEPSLLRARDLGKDQSYYLSSIPQASLSRTIFPIGGLLKPEVRQLAEHYKLPTAQRPESMGICFIGEKRRFSDFISQYMTPKPGKILAIESGKEVGQHNGLWNFTIGENARISGQPNKLFVARKDVERNEIWVAPNSNHSSLYSSHIRVSSFQWISGNFPICENPITGLQAYAQFRHRMEPEPCIVSQTPNSTDPAGGEVFITFKSPQYAVALGQIAAVYIGDQCMGCGVITHVHA